MAAVAAAVAAFAASAHAHRLDAFLAQSICGDPSTLTGATLFLGHCADCWAAAGGAGLAALAVMAGLQARLGFLVPAPGLRSSP